MNENKSEIKYGGSGFFTSQPKMCIGDGVVVDVPICKTCGYRCCLIVGESSYKWVCTQCFMEKDEE